MESTQPEEKAIINDFLYKARKAFDEGDKHSCGILIDSIFRLDFTNNDAWKLLHKLMGEGKPFSLFQREFAQKYYPNKVHLLRDQNDTIEYLPKVESSKPKMANLPPLPPLLVSKNNEKVNPQSSQNRYCPRCGYPNQNNMAFCANCGFQFKPVNSSYPNQGNNPNGGQKHNGDPSQPLRIDVPRINWLTAKGTVAIFGFLLIVLAEVFKWKTFVDIAWLSGNSYDISTGFMTSEGRICAICGVLGVLLTAVNKNHKVTSFFSVFLLVITCISAGKFIGSENWYSGIDYYAMGIGPYIVFIGAFLVLGSFFLPYHKNAS